MLTLQMFGQLLNIVSEHLGSVHLFPCIIDLFPNVKSVCSGLCNALAKGNTMTNGTVKFYNDQKGFGFIAPEGGSTDVFVHATALERAGINGLQEGQKVKFETD